MLRGVFAWWLGQLAALLPSWLRRPPVRTPNALVIAPQEIDCGNAFGATAVWLRRNGKEAPLGEFALSELKGLPHSPRRPAVLRLAKSEVLGKTLTLPLAAQGELDQVLAFEMDRETPFTADEVYWSYRVEAVDRQSGRLSVLLVLLPKAALERILHALAEIGIAPRLAEIAHGTGDFLSLPLDGEIGRPGPGSRAFLWSAAACCGALAFGAVATPFARQAVELATLDREIAVARSTAAEAEALRGDIERLSRKAELVDMARAKAGQPLDVLAAVTQLLPDDTYLTEIDLRQRKLTLSGRSTGAARLIGVLATEGKLHNPAFAAPVTRQEALHTEMFSIVADVGPQP
jgi:general secretion pathway protein L